MGRVMAKFATIYILSQIAAAYMALHRYAQKHALELLPLAPYDASFQNYFVKVKFHRKQSAETLKVTQKLKMPLQKKAAGMLQPKSLQSINPTQKGFNKAFGISEFAEVWSLLEPSQLPVSTGSLLCLPDSTSKVLSF